MYSNDQGTFRAPKWVQCLFLFPPCFRESVNVTCKNNFLLKNVIVFFFGNQISKWCSFEKKAIFDLLFTFFSHQGKDTKIPSAHIPLRYIHVLCSPSFFAFPNLQKLQIYHVWFLFGVTPGVDSFWRHFRAINK